MSADWLTLLPTTPGDPTAVMLFARTRLLLGKLREAPVDLCLRNYPVAVHKDACQRISRNHLSLTWDAIAQRCVVEDLKSPNGTMLDGLTMKAGESATLEAGRDNILVVAGVVSLWVRCLHRTGPAPTKASGVELPPGPCGLDTVVPFDAITITRPENRSELAYAMVLRRLTIGGPGAELVLAGSRTRAACELALIGGRWIWRVAGSPDASWQVLTTGAQLDCGGKTLTAQVGTHDLF
jgi:hypothetical protein